MASSEKRLSTLEPDFKALVEKLLAAAEEETGRRWVVTAGRRTLKEQKDLYAQGRTVPGKVVTKAQPGYSAHNYGLAADLAPLKEGSSITIDWNAGKMIWQKMADEAVKLGLTAGFYFKTFYDAPHVECAAWKKRKDDWLAGKVKLV